MEGNNVGIGVSLTGTGEYVTFIAQSLHYPLVVYPTKGFLYWMAHFRLVPIVLLLASHNGCLQKFHTDNDLLGRDPDKKINQKVYTTAVSHEGADPASNGTTRFSGRRNETYEYGAQPFLSVLR